MACLLLFLGVDINFFNIFVISNFKRDVDISTFSNFAMIALRIFVSISATGSETLIHLSPTSSTSSRRESCLLRHTSGNRHDTSGTSACTRAVARTSYSDCAPAPYTCDWIHAQLSISLPRISLLLLSVACSTTGGKACPSTPTSGALPHPCPPSSQS